SEAWFDDRSDGKGDENVNGDALNWHLADIAASRAPAIYPETSTVVDLPVYNVFGYTQETVGSYVPGSCSLHDGQRTYKDLVNHASPGQIVPGDHTVPVWSPSWPDSGVPVGSQYAIANTNPGSIPNSPAVSDLM